MSEHRERLVSVACRTCGVEWTPGEARVPAGHDDILRSALRTMSGVATDHIWYNPGHVATVSVDGVVLRVFTKGVHPYYGEATP